MLNFKRYIIIEQYLLAVKIKLQYSRKRKKVIIKNFREFIYSCIEEENETIKSKQDLYLLFGTVDKAVENYMEMRDKSEVKDYEKEYKRRKVIAIFLGLLLLIIIIFLIWIRVTSNNAVVNTEFGILESSQSEEVIS